MSNFAEINENKVVVRVLVMDNALPNEGLDWLNENFGGTWVQTSYSGNIRKNYAGIGYTYDSGRDAFIAPRPHLSWQLNEKTCQWEPPSPVPTDGLFYFWSETNLAWELAN